MIQVTFGNELVSSAQFIYVTQTVKAHTDMLSQNITGLCEAEGAWPQQREMLRTRMRDVMSVVTLVMSDAGFE